MGRRGSDGGRQAVIWLATTVMLVLGAATTGVVVMVSMDQSPDAPMVWGGAIAALIIFLIIINLRLEGPVNQMKFWLSFQDRGNPADEYTAARRSIEHREEFGSNQPPSVESVRDAAEHGGAWIPKSTGRRHRRKQS